MLLYRLSRASRGRCQVMARLKSQVFYFKPAHLCNLTCRLRLYYFFFCLFVYSLYLMSNNNVPSGIMWWYIVCQKERHRRPLLGPRRRFHRRPRPRRQHGRSHWSRRIRPHEGISLDRRHRRERRNPGLRCRIRATQSHV